MRLLWRARNSNGGDEVKQTEEWSYCDGNGGLEKKADWNRRALLTAGFAGALWMMSQRSALAQASIQSDPKHDNVLVVIFLRGGCDGLNFLVPHGEDEYYKARPTLAIGKPGKAGDAAVDLDGFFGLHPSLRPLESYFKEGEAAFVHAVGSWDQTRSHFEAMSAMERGLGSDLESGGGGWLGRHIANNPGRVSPVRAVSLSSTMPDSLGGAIGALAIESLADYKLATDNHQMLNLLAQFYKEEDDAIQRSGRDTLKVLHALDKVNPKDYKPENGANYPDKPLARSLREAAFLIKQDLGLEVACLDMGGWDTHVAQGGSQGWHATLLSELGDAVDAFMKDLGRRRDKVTVVIQTEFGRRIDENSGFGTDHGRAGVMAVLGGGVKGNKVYGEWPTLSVSKREGPGDLKVTTDYRDVLTEVLASRLISNNLGAVFPGLKHKPLGLMA